MEYRDASYSPEPMPYEIRDAVAQANDAMVSLKEENERLSARLLALASAPAEKAPVILPIIEPTQTDDPAFNGSIVPALPQAVSRVAPPERSLFRSFRPNPDGLIEINPEFAYRPPGTPRMPFQQVYFPKVQIQEAQFTVSLLSPGADSSAILNGKIVAPSDVLEGFSVDEISDEGLWLKRHYYRIWLPYAQKITVRYPL
jgi:hypothetical protein